MSALDDAAATIATLAYVDASSVQLGARDCRAATPSQAAIFGDLEAIALQRQQNAGDHLATIARRALGESAGLTVLQALITAAGNERTNAA